MCVKRLRLKLNAHHPLYVNWDQTIGDEVSRPSYGVRLLFVLTSPGCSGAFL